jgi:hypothetical protein
MTTARTPCRSRCPRRSGEAGRTPTRLTRPAVTATLGLLSSRAWRTAAVVGARAAGAAPGGVERQGLAMRNRRNAGAAAGGGAIYGLGIFGALVYFWQQADTLWEHLLAVVQGLFWPAFMVYEVFKALRHTG